MVGESGGPCNHRCRVVDLGLALRRRVVMPLLHGRIAPLISAQIDQHANQPRLLPFGAVRHRLRGPDRPKERLRHEIERFVCTRGQSSSEAIDAFVMGVEQRGDPVGRLLDPIVRSLAIGSPSITT